MSHRPRFSFGYGSWGYKEQKFKIAPGLKSSFKESCVLGAVGWEFLTEQSAISIDLDFMQTESGTEKWKNYGMLGQKNDLEIWRLGLDLGVLWSTWDRRGSARQLVGRDRYFRLSLGPVLYYRHLNFTRDSFVRYDSEGVGYPIDITAQECFDMLGYRYHYMDVSREKKTGEVGPYMYVVELPDNETESHLFFCEAAIPF